MIPGNQNRNLGNASKSEGIPRDKLHIASSTERGEVFYGPTDWLGSRDPMTPVRYTRGSLLGLAD